MHSPRRSSATNIDHFVIMIADVMQENQVVGSKF